VPTELPRGSSKSLNRFKKLPGRPAAGIYWKNKCRNRSEKNLEGGKNKKAASL